MYDKHVKWYGFLKAKWVVHQRYSLHLRSIQCKDYLLYIKDLKK